MGTSYLSRDEFFLFYEKTAPQWARVSSLLKFHDYTHLDHTTFGRAPLDERSSPRRDLYLTTHNIHKRQTSMYLAGFEPAIPASERTQTHALDRAATEISILSSYLNFEEKIRQRSSGYTRVRGAGKSLARPGRKQATATEDFDFRISYL